MCVCVWGGGGQVRACVRACQCAYMCAFVKHSRNTSEPYCQDSEVLVMVEFNSLFDQCSSICRPTEASPVCKHTSAAFNTAADIM